MDAELKSFLQTVAESMSDDDIIEYILDCGKTVWTGSPDRHRWYSMIPTVVEIKGRFISYNMCDVHGETANVDDCIGGYKLEMFSEVFPKEKIVIVYERQK